MWGEKKGGGGKVEDFSRKLREISMGTKGAENKKHLKQLSRERRRRRHYRLIGKKETKKLWSKGDQAEKGSVPKTKRRKGMLRASRNLFVDKCRFALAKTTSEGKRHGGNNN